jgi:hypothetical protein
LTVTEKYTYRGGPRIFKFSRFEDLFTPFREGRGLIED